MSPNIEDYQTHIDAALAYAGGTHTYADIAAMVAVGEAQFWPGEQACVVTQVVPQPHRTVFYIFLAAGNLQEIERLSHEILAWGKAQGCSLARFAGRRGWDRTFLTRTGWTAEMVVFEKALL